MKHRVEFDYIQGDPIEIRKLTPQEQYALRKPIDPQKFSIPYSAHGKSIYSRFLRAIIDRSGLRRPSELANL
jgi:hypothetical protein